MYLKEKNIFQSSHFKSYIGVIDYTAMNTNSIPIHNKTDKTNYLVGRKISYEPLVGFECYSLNGVFSRVCHFSVITIVSLKDLHVNILCVKKDFPTMFTKVNHDAIIFEA